MKSKQNIWILMFLGLGLFLTRCSKDDPFLQSRENYLVLDQNNAASDRLVSKNNSLSYRSFKAGNDENQLNFTLEYQLSSPQVDGSSVQATHITYKAKKLYLSYNTRGDLVRGGMEIIDFSNPAEPKVSATGIRDGEFNSLDIYTSPVLGRSYLILAGAGIPEVGKDPSQVRIFELDASGNPIIDPIIIDMKGYTATDVNQLGLVSGTEGAFFILDEQSMSFAEVVMDVNDARSVAYDETSGQYLILSGNPGRLITGLPQNPETIELGGITQPGSKASVRTRNGFAFVTLGEAGLKVVDLGTQRVVSSLDRPVVPTGENENNYVTNAVSVHDEGYLFIANGAAGVYVAKYDESGSVELLGQLDLDASVNYVEADGEYLFAAIGAGGVAIIRMSGVSGPDPLVITHQVTQSGITAYSAMAGGVADRNDGEEILNKGVCWSTETHPDINDSRSNQGPGEGSFVSQLSGLDPLTTYYYRAYVTTAKGTFYGAIYSFTTKNEEYTSDVLVDHRDGNEYRTLIAGSKIWMAENLAWLPAVSPVASGSLIDPYYYVYGYNGFKRDEAASLSSYKDYGVLYNWVAAQNACPDGWHLPSDEDWMELEQYLGMSADEASAVRFRESGQVGSTLKSTSGWYEEGNGTDVAGFTALPSGYRARGGEYKYQGSYAAFWTNDENTNLGTYRALYYFNDGVYRSDWYKTAGFSVRCVKEK